MPLFMNIYYGDALNKSADSYDPLDEFGYESGPAFGHIHFVHYSGGRFYLGFDQKKQQDAVCQLTGWQLVDIASFGAIKRGLCLPFAADQESLTCLNPRTKEMMDYNAFYLESGKSNHATMQMIMMVKKPHGQRQLILDRIGYLTFIHGEYTLWFRDEAAVQYAKEETGWRNGGDVFSLILPLNTINSVRLLAE